MNVKCSWLRICRIFVLTSLKPGFPPAGKKMRILSCPYPEHITGGVEVYIHSFLTSAQGTGKKRQNCPCARHVSMQGEEK